MISLAWFQTIYKKFSTHAETIFTPKVKIFPGPQSIMPKGQPPQILQPLMRNLTKVAINLSKKLP